MRTSALAILALAFAACASGTVTEPVTITVSDADTLPSVPGPSIALPPQTFDTPIDVSDAIDKVNSVTDSIEIDVSSLTLDSSTPFDWLKQATVTVQPQSGGPNVPFAHLAGVAGNTATFAIDISSSDLLAAFSVPAVLHFTVSGQTTDHEVVIDDTMSFVISGHASKSL